MQQNSILPGENNKGGPLRVCSVTLVRAAVSAGQSLQDVAPSALRITFHSAKGVPVTRAPRASGHEEGYDGMGHAAYIGRLRHTYCIVQTMGKQS